MRAASDLHRCSLVRRVAMETCVTRFRASISEASEDTLVSPRATLDDTNLSYGRRRRRAINVEIYLDEEVEEVDEDEEEEEEEDGAPLAYKHIRWHNRRGRYASIWSVL